MHTHTHGFVHAHRNLPFRYAAHSYMYILTIFPYLLLLYMTGYSVLTLRVRDLYVHSLYILYTPTSMHFYIYAHTPILEICLLEQVWKALSVFSGCTTRVDLIFFEILQETETSKIVVKVDMMVFTS